MSDPPALPGSGDREVNDRPRPQTLSRVEAPALPQPKTGLVYFVQAGTDGPIKIGFTRRVITERLAQISPTSAAQLRLLLTIPGTRATEREEHDFHARYRLRGEWFKPGNGLRSWIRALRNDPGLATDKLRLGVAHLDGLEYAPLPGHRPGPQLSSGVPGPTVRRTDRELNDAAIAVGVARMGMFLACARASAVVAARDEQSPESP